MTGWLAASGVALVLLASLYAGISGSSAGGGSPPAVQTTRNVGSPIDAQKGDQVQTPKPEPPMESTLTPGSAEMVQATPTNIQVLNRLDCAKIRGTQYHSAEERTWFLSNCVRR
jgi:hypothetical protein